MRMQLDRLRRGSRALVEWIRARLHAIQGADLFAPVPDEPDVEARERLHSAADLTRPLLRNPGHGRWGYGLGDPTGEDVDEVASEHARLIRAIHRFGLHDTVRESPRRLTPAEMAALEQEYLEGRRGRPSRT